MNSSVQEPTFAFINRKKELRNKPWRRKRYTRQPALNAVRNVKFLSSLTQPDQFTAENAGLGNDPRDQDDTKPITLDF